MEEQLERIKEKLKYVQNIGWEKYEENFAFWAHKLKMKPPLPLEKLLYFEQAYNIKLPEGYRRFLLEVGNGGAGPYYGIVPLEKWMFAFTKSLDEDYPFEAVDHFSGECKARPLPDKNYGVVPEDKWLSGWDKGTITLCDQGCNYFCLLVVRGKEQGRICYMGMMGEPYYMPDVDFLSWYERWLDETMRGERIGWFGGSGWMTHHTGLSNLVSFDLEE